MVRLRITLTSLIIFLALSESIVAFHNDRIRNIDMQSYAPSPVPDRIVLTWTGDPAATQAVTWRSDTTIVQAIAEIAEADPTPDFVHNAKRFEAETQSLETENGISLHHSVVFRDLQPNTLYVYRVGDGEIWSEWFQFKTAKDSPAPFSFIYFGDAQNNIKSMWSRAIRQAYSDLPKASFMLHAGDLVNLRHDRHDSEWGEWFGAGQWLFGMVPSIPSPGNHEYEYEPEFPRDRWLSPHWRTHFTLPIHGPEGLEETVYFIDYQGVRIISLNTEAMNLDEADAVRQAEWLETVLNDNPNRWTIMTHHHPMFSAGRGRPDNEMLNKHIRKLYERYRVDIVLQGHDHTYARGMNIPEGKNLFDEDSTVMYVVSVSGPKMYEISADWMDMALENTQLYQLISIDNDTLTFEAYTVTGLLYDSFQLVKRDSAPNKLIEGVTAE